MKQRDKISDKDIEISRLKGSGPGGQNRNKRETGIRIKHLPTGSVVNATERRSQKQNLEKALDRLTESLEKLYTKPIPRKKTKPSRSSKKVRLESKRHHAKKKAFRSAGRYED